MKKLKYLLSIVMLTLVIASCRKFVTIPPPQNQLVSNAVFGDSADATAAVIGIYASIMNQFDFDFGNGGITLYTGLEGDELYPTTVSPDDNEFYQNTIPSNSEEALVFWINAYQVIYQSNACLEGVQASTGLSAACKSELKAEALVSRAFLYFYMVNLWDAVPLETTTNYNMNEVMPRTSRDSVYTQIVSDLTTADSLFITSGQNMGPLRPNQYAACGLLAKVCLYLGQWKNAETYSSQVISSGGFSLVQNPNNVFLKGSAEAILQFAPVINGLETMEGYYFVQSGVIPSYVITNTLLNSFEQGDLRFTDWLDSNEINGQAYYFPYKYKLGYDGWPNGGPSEYYMILRLGEQYLIRAEAEAELGDSTDAISDLNMIRNRAQLPNYNPANQGGLLTAIQHERQIEMAYEWGNRWFDLKRTGTINNVLGKIDMKPGWQAMDTVLPIPYNEIHLNSFLTQNAGY
jgi:hypothetical protein